MLSLIAVLSLAIPASDARVVDLESKIAPIYSASRLPQSTEATLKRAIGTSRVVMLGELTHGDGTSHAIKTSLVKFLHSKMGFDVLVWESGLYDCAEMDSALAGKKPIQEVASMGVFSHWSKGAETLPVFEYARETQAGPRPLRMAGFDLQASGSASNSMFPDFLDWFKDRPELTPEDRAAVDAVFALARHSGTNQQAAIMAVYDTAPRFLKAVDAHADVFRSAWGRNYELRRQAISNAVEYGEMLRSHAEVQAGKRAFAEPYNHRERVNADNILWLVNHRFRGKKVIVWGHNVHIFKGLPSQQSGLSVEPGPGIVDSMGRLVARELKGDLYSVGVVAHRGTWSWLGNPVIDFRPASDQSLESLLHQTGERHGFLDLRGIERDSWLRKPIAATIDQQNPLSIETNWADGFDGLLYIDKMAPRRQL